MLSELFDLISRISPNLKRSCWRVWYEYLAGAYTGADWAFMNFGFVELDPHAPPLALSRSDEKDRPAIQLYHHVVRDVDLRGLDILEVGCGRGGGCSYLMRYLRPRSVTGVDFSQNAIALCKTRHAAAGLSFLRGDAESLPFPDAAFDVVISVESSHCFGSMERFLAQVVRVLRPKGYFLFADLRDTDGAAVLRKQLRSCRLALLKEEAITLNVLQALERDHERKLIRIRQMVPRLFHRPFKQFAAVKGTKMYKSLRHGQADYLSCVLRKDAA